MRLIRLKHDLWVNPDLITRIEQHGDNTVIFFASGREKAMLNTAAVDVVRKIQEATAE